VIDPPKYRKLTPRECFRLQTVPGYHIDTLLNAGELSSHYQLCYNELNHKHKGALCKNVKSKTVISQSQVEKLDYAINTTLGSLDTEPQSELGSLSIRAKHVQKKGVIVTARQQKDYASSTTSSGKELSQKPESVRFAITVSKEGVVDCALSTTNQNSEMETQLRLTLTSKENSNLMGIKGFNIIKTQTVDGLIELLLRKSQEENSEKVKSYITLMGINLITARGISCCANRTHLTYLFIDSLSQSQCSSLEMAISCLKMGVISPLSNSSLYKMCGNGWTMKVISHIFKAMLCTKQ